MADPQVEVDILANDRNVSQALSNIQQEIGKIQRALSSRMAREFRNVNRTASQSARTFRRVRINVNDMRQSFQRAGAAASTSAQTVQRSLEQERLATERSAQANRVRVEQIRAASRANTATMQQETTRLRSENRVREREIQRSTRRFVAIWRAASQQILLLQQQIGQGFAALSRTIATALQGAGSAVRNGMQRMTRAVTTGQSQMSAAQRTGLTRQETQLRQSMTTRERIIRRSATRQQRAMAAGAGATGAATRGAAAGGAAGGILGRGGILGGLAVFGGFRAVTEGLRAGWEETVRLTEELNRSEVIFGQNADAIQDWASNSTRAFGLARGEALRAAGNFGQLLASFEFEQDSLNEWSQRFTEMAVDLASFNDIPIEQGIDALRAGLAGESEPLRDLGVDARVAALETTALNEGLIEQGEELDAETRALAVYHRVMDDASEAMGDAARTSATIASQQRIARAELLEFAAAILENFIPAATAGLDVFNRLLGTINDLIRGEDLSAVAEAFRSFAGGAGAATAAVLGMRALPPILSAVRAGASALLTPFRLALLAAGVLGGAFNVLLNASDALPDALGRLGEVLSELGSGVVEAFGDVADAIDFDAILQTASEGIASFADTLAELIVGTIAPALQDFAEFMLGTAIPAVIEFGEEVGEFLAPYLEQIGGFITDTVVPAFEDLWGAIQDDVIPAVQDAASGLLETLRPAFDAIVDVGADLVDTLGGPTGVAAVLGGVAASFAAFRVGGPVLGGVVGGIGALLGLFPELRDAVIGVGEAIGDLFTGGGDFGDVGEAFQELGSVIVDMASRAIDNLSDLGSDVLSTIEGWFRDIDWNAVAMTALSGIERIGFHIGNVLTDPRVILGAAATAAGMVVVALQFVRGFASALIENLGELIEIIGPPVRDALGDALSAAADGLGDVVQAAFSEIADLIGQAIANPQVILGALAALLTAGAIRRALSSVVGTFRNIGQNAGTQMATHTRISFQQGITGIGAAMRGVVNREMRLGQAIRLAATNARGAISAVGQQVGNTLATSIGAAVSGFAAGRAESGLGQAFGLAGVAGSTAAAFSIGGPIAGAITGLSGLVGTAFGNMSQAAEEAEARVDGFTDAIIRAREEGESVADALTGELFDQLAESAPEALEAIDELPVGLDDVTSAISNAGSQSEDAFGPLLRQMGFARDETQNLLDLIASGDIGEIAVRGEPAFVAAREAVEGLNIPMEDAIALLEILADRPDDVDEAFRQAGLEGVLDDAEENINRTEQAVGNVIDELRRMNDSSISQLESNIDGLETEVDGVEESMEQARRTMDEFFQGIRPPEAEETSARAIQTLQQAADTIGEFEFDIGDLNLEDNVADSIEEADFVSAVAPLRNDIADSTRSIIEEGVASGASAADIQADLEQFFTGMRQEINQAFDDDEIDKQTRDALREVVNGIADEDWEIPIEAALEEERLGERLETLTSELERLNVNLEVQFDRREALAALEEEDPIEAAVELLPELDPVVAQELIDNMTIPDRIELQAQLDEAGIDIDLPTEGLSLSDFGYPPMRVPTEWEDPEEPPDFIPESGPALGIGHVNVGGGEATSFAGNLADQMGGAIEDIVVSGSIQTMLNNSVSELGPIGVDEVGASIATSIAEGIANNSGVVTVALTGMVLQVGVALSSSVGVMSDAGSNFGVAFAEGITSQSGLAVSAAVTSGGAVVGALATHIPLATGTGSSVGAGFAGGVGSQTGAAASAGSSLGSAAASAASGLYGSFYSAGVDAGAGFSAGLRSAATSAASEAQSIANSAASAVRSTLEITSPSRVFRRMGEDTAAGFVGGLESSRPFVQRGFRDTWGRMLTDWEDRVQRSVDAIQGSFESLSSTQFSAATDFAAALAEMRQAARDFEGPAGTFGRIGVGSERGRANRGIIAQQVDAAQEIVTNLVEAGASADRITERFSQMRRDIVVTARQSGISADAINTVLSSLNFTMGDLREAFGARRVSPLDQFESEMESFLQDNLGVPFQQVVRQLAQMLRSTGVPIGGELRSQIEQFVRSFRRDPVRRFGNEVERAADRTEALNDNSELLPQFEQFGSALSQFAEDSRAAGLGWRDAANRAIRTLRQLGATFGRQEANDIRDFFRNTLFGRDVQLEQQLERRAALQSPGELLPRFQRFESQISQFAEDAQEAGLGWRQAGNQVIEELEALGLNIGEPGFTDVREFVRNTLFAQTERLDDALADMVDELTAGEQFVDEFGTQLDRIIEEFADTPGRIDEEIQAALEHAGLGEEAGQFAREINRYIAEVLDDPARKLDEYLEELTNSQQQEEFNVPNVEANVYPQFGDPEAIALATANAIATQVRGG